MTTPPPIPSEVSRADAGQLASTLSPYLWPATVLCAAAMLSLAGVLHALIWSRAPVERYYFVLQKEVSFAVLPGIYRCDTTNGEIIRWSRFTDPTTNKIETKSQVITPAQE